MSDLRTLLERGVGGATPPPEGFDRLLRRRDRKRRNQRIAAGVVGIGVFVAAVATVTTIGSSGPPQPAGSGGALTGPAATGPSGTGTLVPLTPAPGDGWGGHGLPPEDAEPSTPSEGELVAEHDAVLGPDLVYVYADGRVLWHTEGDELIYELRLSPQGVELVRSGDVPPSGFLHASISLPADALADPEVKSYVPSWYAICGLEPSQLGMLPPRAEALLLGAERFQGSFGADEPEACYPLTTTDARALDGILADADFERMVGGGGDTGIVALTFVPVDWPGGPIEITFRLYLPHRVVVPNTPG